MSLLVVNGKQTVAIPFLSISIVTVGGSVGWCWEDSWCC